MVEEVNKIIYNMLISGRGVFLPEVGTLFIERQGARKISGDRLLSPRNAVNFVTQEQAPSLVAEIASIAGCGEEQALDIYTRWLDKTRAGGTITIGGVGVLREKSFSAESAFAAAINPEGVKTLVIRRSSNTWLYAVCGVCVLVAVCVGVYMLWGDKLFGGMSVVRSGAPTEVAQTVTDTTAVAAMPADTLTGAVAVTEGAAAPAVEGITQAAADVQSVAAVPAKEPEAPAAKQGGKYAYYVVMGVFSTEQNAERALKQAEGKISDMNGAILPFKGKFITAVFGSDNRDDCAAFARSYRDIYPDLWIYNDR